MFIYVIILLPFQIDSSNSNQLIMINVTNILLLIETWTLVECMSYVDTIVKNLLPYLMEFLLKGDPALSASQPHKQLLCNQLDHVRIYQIRVKYLESMRKLANSRMLSKMLRQCW